MSIFQKLTRRLPARDRAAPRPTPVSTPVSAEHVDLATVFRLLRARWGTIVVVLALFVGAAFAYAVTTPKTWRTSARVLLDPRDKQIVGSDVGRQVQGMELGWVETRLELVKSYDTLAEVVKRENLIDDPEILSPAARAAAGDQAIAAAVRDLSDMVLVERPKENALIDVTVTSRSPEKAARLANAVARAYVDGLAAAKVDQVEHANALLARQVDEMRSKMLEAEARVENYKRDHGIAITRGNLVEEETLRQSNENLIAARLKMQEARERSERLDQALKSGDPTVLSQNDTIGSAVISRLKIEAAMAARRKSELEQTLGPRHPRVTSAAAEVERSRAQVAEEVKSLAATADLDYQVARANEDNARKALERAQARLSDVSQAAVGLQELENEANARRELYKTFVSRMEETTLQRNTQVSDARIVSPAQVPLRPFSPRAGLAMALAVVAGLGTGIGLALHRGRALLHPVHPIAPVPTAVEPPVVPAAPTVEPTADPDPAPDVAPEPRAETPASVVATAEPIAATPVEPVVAAPTPQDDHPIHAATPTEAVAPAVEVAPPAALAVDVPASPEPLAEPPADAAVRAEPRRTTLAVPLEALARLGLGGETGGGVAALVETAAGTPDEVALARFTRLADELPTSARPCVRVIFSNSVPTLLTAAVAHGLARVGGETALIDLAHEGSAFDPLFEAGTPLAVDATAAEAWERVEVAGLCLERPLDPVVAGDPALRVDLRGDIAELRARGRDAVIHLGRTPTAALLFDCAAEADHVVVVIDEKDLAGRRVADEIAVMGGLVPHFDGVVVLAHAPEDSCRPLPDASRRAAG
ncbi:MAG: hypothetical protein GX458_09140 [Phyllobacteriaceae bacterium]|nr:hypothetical protein [Phyllobacteriaceae bacterium]